MLELQRLTIGRQRRVGQALADLAKDAKFMKGLAPDARDALTAAVEAAGALDTGAGLSPLLVDTSADVVFSAFESWLDATKRGMTDKVVTTLPPAIAAKKAAASTLHATLFGKGTGFLRLDMPLQYKAMRDVVTALRDDATCTAAVKELGAGFWVDHMAAHLVPYGHAVKTQDGRDLEAAGGAFHDALRQVVLKMLNHHDDDAALKTAVLGSYERELATQREDERQARKRRKKAKDERVA